MQPWQYLPCIDCQQAEYHRLQASRGLYARLTRTLCADGQDGLCSDHRGARRYAQLIGHPIDATQWRGPLPEGQE